MRVSACKNRFRYSRELGSQGLPNILKLLVAKVRKTIRTNIGVPGRMWFRGLRVPAEGDQGFVRRTVRCGFPSGTYWAG